MAQTPEQRSHWRNATESGPPLEEIARELRALLRATPGLGHGGIEALVRVSQGRGDELVWIADELKRASEHMAERAELRVLASRLNADKQ